MPADAPDWVAPSAYSRVKLYPDGTPASSMGPAPTFPSFSVTANGTNTQTFTPPANVTNFRIMVVGSTHYRFQAVGHQTGISYLQSVDVDGYSNFTSANSPFKPIDIRIEPSWDTGIDITVTDESNVASKVYVSALFGAETTVLAGASTQIPVFMEPGGETCISTDFQTLAMTAVQIVIAAAAGSDLTLLGWFGMADTSAAGARLRMEDTTGALLVDFSGFTSRTVAGYVMPRPKPLTPGAGLQMHNPGSANAVYDLTIFVG